MTSFQKVACWFLSCCTDHTESIRLRLGTHQVNHERTEVHDAHESTRSCFVFCADSTFSAPSGPFLSEGLADEQDAPSYFEVRANAMHGKWCLARRPAAGRAIWGEAVRPWPCPPWGLVHVHAHRCTLLHIENHDEKTFGLRASCLLRCQLAT